MNKLAMHGGQAVFQNDEGKFKWPKYDQFDEISIVKQLHDSVSIYDRSGVIKEFEDTFAAYHEMPYSLLSNSGTSAIYSMYEGLNLCPGDEVLCPVYTFHATVSPLMYTGALPVFCDCDLFGNISLDEIRIKTTNKTKAVIITHMWGMPAEKTQEIANFCKDNNLALLEDCSHAHGARIENIKVGSFGVAAAWSLQGQKLISGGEGGIMLTKSKPLFERALLQGHYNKRPKNEINQNSPLSKYNLTGFGQKFRAHPLAVRLALNQFNKLDKTLLGRQLYVNEFVKNIVDLEFLEALLAPAGIRSSHYALIAKFKSGYFPNVTREEFVKALHSEGLCEVDIPQSTGPLNEQKLFITPNEVLPRLYDKPLALQENFPEAELFHGQIIKLPVGDLEEDKELFDGYVKGIRKVAKYLIENKSLILT